ncbi:MAG: esterase [Bacteroidales bacterium]|nr:esterase [Bacteroidales bacterium]
MVERPGLTDEVNVTGFGVRKEEFMLSGRSCLLLSAEAPEVILVEPVDENDLAFLDRETRCLAENSARPFALVTFIVRDWNNELAPWKAAPVFGKEPFGEGASGTLDFIEDELLPYLAQANPFLGGLPVIVGGYSLAALFALWAGYVSERFAAVAAASPLVWYPGWMDFARNNRPLAGRIYLSLGDAEEKTRNKVMATVGARVREQAGLLSGQGIDCTLEWNPGNHFKDADLRTAKAFLWAIGSLPSSV